MMRFIAPRVRLRFVYRQIVMVTRRVSEGWCRAEVYPSLTLRVTKSVMAQLQNSACDYRLLVGRMGPCRGILG